MDCFECDQPESRHVKDCLAARTTALEVRTQNRLYQFWYVLAIFLAIGATGTDSNWWATLLNVGAGSCMLIGAVDSTRK